MLWLAKEEERRLKPLRRRVLSELKDIIRRNANLYYHKWIWKEEGFSGASGWVVLYFDRRKEKWVRLEGNFVVVKATAKRARCKVFSFAKKTFKEQLETLLAKKKIDGNTVFRIYRLFTRPEKGKIVSQDLIVTVRLKDFYDVKCAKEHKKQG